MSLIDVATGRDRETLADLIRQHDNIFKLSEKLSSFLKDHFQECLENGRTPACLAAAIGKRTLATAIIQAGGGGRIPDWFGRTAEDYLRSPTTPEERQAKAAHDALQMKTMIVRDEIQAEVEAEIRAHPPIARISKNDL